MQVRGWWRVAQTCREVRLRTRVAGWWRVQQACREVRLRTRVAGWWRVQRAWREVLLASRVRGAWRLQQAWHEARLRLRVHGFWRLQSGFRELKLRWSICFGVPLSPAGVLRLMAGGVGAAMPRSTLGTTVFLVRAAAAARSPAPASLGSDTGQEGRSRVLMICAHEPKMDPRIGWEADWACRQFDVTVLGFNREDGSEPAAEQAGGYRILRLRRGDLPPSRYFWRLKDLCPVWGLALLALAAVLMLPLAALVEIVVRLVRWPVRAAVRGFSIVACGGRRLWNRERVDFVLGNLRMQFAPAAELFCDHIAAMPAKPHVVHCNDLDTLFVGVLAKRAFGCGVVYDAHEFWPVMDSTSTWIDRTFFSLLERFLIGQADAVVTVNPMLAQVMREAYRLPRVSAVPNVEPWVDRRPAMRARSAMAELAGNRVRFLFQGRFTKGRGIEQIITAWQQVDGGKAALFLRGPDNAWRRAAIELADRLGILQRSIYFLDPVEEAELVCAAAEADVGIIPYLPLAINDRLACPNKLSQYLHAGLMVLTNDLPYVRSVVAEAQAGIWYDAAENASFAAAVQRIVAEPDLLRDCRRNALAFARDNYNWQRHGGIFLDLYAANAPRQAPQPRLFAAGPAALASPSAP